MLGEDFGLNKLPAQISAFIKAHQEKIKLQLQQPGSDSRVHADLLVKTFTYGDLQPCLEFDPRGAHGDAPARIFRADLDPEAFRHVGCRVHFFNLNAVKPLWRDRRSAADRARGIANRVRGLSPAS